MVIVYSYRNCSTCRKALAWLRERKIPFEERPVRESPPRENELRLVLAAYEGDLRRLFNTSGQEYRRLKLKDRLPGMKAEEAMELLSRNGALVKRPLLLTESSGRAGFKEEEWESVLRP